MPNLKFYKWYKFVWCKRESESEGVRRKVWLMAKDSHQPVTNRKVGIPTFVHQWYVCLHWNVWESMRKLFTRTLYPADDFMYYLSVFRLYWMSECSLITLILQRRFWKWIIGTWTPWYHPNLKLFILLNCYLVV